MIWSFYDLSTGIFTGTTFSGPKNMLPLNTPEGCGACMGTHDHLSRRFDLETGEVVDWQPPKPDDNELETFSWDNRTRRWVAAPTANAVARSVRARRDDLLAECDWVTFRAIDRGEPAPADWLAYRQALRDLPQQAGFPGAVEWPSAPQ